MQILFESKLKMIATTINFLNGNPSLTEVPRYNTLYNDLTGKYQKVQELVRKLLYTSTGVTKNKNNLQNQVLKITCEFCNMLTIYAKDFRLTKLETEVRQKPYIIARKTGVTLLEFAKGVLERARGHSDNLKEYGISAEMIEEFTNLLPRFETAVTSVRMTQAERKQARVESLELIKQITDILNDIDRILYRYRTTDSQFYAGYKSVRTVVETRSGSIAVKGIVTDAETGEPVTGVILEIIMKEKGTRLVKRSAARGGFHIRKLMPGTYIITTRKQGYLPKTEEITVTESLLTEVKIEIQRV